ncbi:threonylcarbamoyl-AMP synthase [Clostridium oryzae]|uniref:Threonylcarbamoyl-AMP synthase n=2 Tax=Clostridium oryzae TaxID=1450648 RepID=A0A1V4IUF6_9CLOT|nr:threonylcarbamoyl-AMP synthase [Clostridium oryzae]
MQMNTKIIDMDENSIDINKMKSAADIIKKGGLVAFPTETVYGLGANALDEDAVKKIFLAKGRPQDNPLIVHVADFNIENFVEEVPDIARTLMNKFWPGPLTIILKKSKLIPDTTSAGLDSVGIRMPKNKIALNLIKLSGCPIAAPSANISGRPSPTVISRCIEDLDGKVDCIIGGDKSNVGVESTVIDCTADIPCVLRPGGVTLEMLQEVNKDIYIDPAVMGKSIGNIKPKAPGMKYKHYAPKAQVRIIMGQTEKTVEKINKMVQNYRGVKVGVMCTDETKEMYNCDEIISLGSRKDLASVAQNLFEVLRSFDDIGVDIVLSEAFEERGIGIAIMNRLKKSAAFDIIKI